MQVPRDSAKITTVFNSTGSDGVYWLTGWIWWLDRRNVNVNRFDPSAKVITSPCYPIEPQRTMETL